MRKRQRRRGINDCSIEHFRNSNGRIFTHLIEKNLFGNTVIIFASDNGSYRLEANGGLKAVKSYLCEGGIRVPGIFHLKGFHNEPGKVINEAAGLVDILPTLCDILEIKVTDKNKLDGTSILNLLKGKKFNRKKPLFWFFYRTSPEIAVRIGDHVIMGKHIDMVPRSHQFSAQDTTYIKNMKLIEYELYNLTDDIFQSTNVLNDSPK